MLCRVPQYAIGLFFVLLLVWTSQTLTSKMQNRPVAVQLGFTPPASVLKAVSGEHRQTVAGFVTLKVLMYFGYLVEEWKSKVVLLPEYFNMYQTLDIALCLDPYNADVYYFTQAVFTWDAGRVREANRFLEHGMKYRTWDPMLPFFAGFNTAYFLQNYDKAAHYMEKAAKIANNPAMVRLASRYYYETGRTDLAVGFLEEMIRSAPSRQEMELYQLRHNALITVKQLQNAADVYYDRFEVYPRDLHELIAVGLLENLPTDPYGGVFFIDKMGRVRSTSKLTLKSDRRPDINR
jgi:hypothetical protein